ncbi:MAG: serine/threonine protein kinase [Pyrinomonadaceae bacterium]|nr:serine/threonine protein kinase [Pyrinomonadaceae bacterium]
MLYCPKCQQTYQEGSQRFCLNEGERLLPTASAAKSANQTGGVFSNILNRKTGEERDKFASVPKFSPADSPAIPQPNFRSSATGDTFTSEPEFELLELELEPPPIKPESAFLKPLTPPIKAEETSILEIPAAELKSAEAQSEETPNKEIPGDVPTVSTDKIVSTPATLPDSSLKNRYRLGEQIGEDENSTSFLAKDTIADSEKIVVKFLKDIDAEDSFNNQIYAEERNSMARINHPNIVTVIDSGESANGKPFIVTEFVEGKTVKDYLAASGQFNALRTARIVRQTAVALGEAHQNGVLHRNLKPQDIILTVDQSGAERVKLTNFGAAKEKLSEENLLYKSPEQVEGKIANFASDNYALAVIAYQMLTNRLPFNASSVGDLLKSQREGLRMRPSDVRFDLPAPVDGIFKKALAFNSFDRYQRTRDFGDALFDEIVANAPLEAANETEKESAAAAILTEPADKTSTIAPVAEIHAPTIRIVDKLEETAVKALPESSVKAAEDAAWEKRSPELPNDQSRNSSAAAIFGVAILVAALFGVWYYFINRPNEVFAPPAAEIGNQNSLPIAVAPLEANVNTAPPLAEIETPPIARSIRQPPDSVYYQNSKESLKGDKMKNFLGFSLFYPQGWTVAETGDNFFDAARKAPNGLPIEQMLISYYDSKGTFKADVEIFPVAVKKTNETLKKIIPNYKLVAEGQKTVNNGWQAYEMKFEGKSTGASGEEITIWGKRLFIPTALRGMKNGYVITMLATSLSKDVQSVEDVGVRGELSSVLETFEPNQNF